MTVQNTTVISVGYVEPNSPSTSQLGEGTYTLNKRSNVPYVSLVGSLGYRKTISWGEIADVPCRELVTVHNASYHGGDIFINKGDDTNNWPRRISVPVGFRTTSFISDEGPQTLLQTNFPCDTRAAKRAYFNVDARVALESPIEELRVYTRGRRLDGSMQSGNGLFGQVSPFGPGLGYLNGYVYPILSDLNYIPLGQGASESDDTRPHNLLDASDVFINIGNSSLIQVLRWPADAQDSEFFPVPSPNSPYPAAWFVIEY